MVQSKHSVTVYFKGGFSQVPLNKVFFSNRLGIFGVQGSLDENKLSMQGKQSKVSFHPLRFVLTCRLAQPHSFQIMSVKDDRAILHQIHDEKHASLNGLLRICENHFICCTVSAKWCGFLAHDVAVVILLHVLWRKNIPYRRSSCGCIMHASTFVLSRSRAHAQRSDAKSFCQDPDVGGMISSFRLLDACTLKRTIAWPQSDYAGYTLAYSHRSTQ